MKRLYKRRCWLVVDGWICEGYKDKYGFHLTEANWDNDAYSKPWKFKKKDIFYNFDEAAMAFEKKYGYKMLLQYYEDSMEMGI